MAVQYVYTMIDLGKVVHEFRPAPVIRAIRRDHVIDDAIYLRAIVVVRFDELQHFTGNSGSLNVAALCERPVGCSNVDYPAVAQHDADESGSIGGKRADLEGLDDVLSQQLQRTHERDEHDDGFGLH